MGLTKQNSAFWWLGFVALLVGVGYYYWQAFVPFLLAFVLAFYLDPLVRRMERLGVKRTVSTALMLGLFFITFFALLGVLVPLFVKQAFVFAELLPKYAKTLDGSFIETWRQKLIALTGLQIPRVQDALGDHLGELMRGVGHFFTGVLAGGQSLAGFIGLLVITPLVTFYLLLDWPSVRTFVRDTLPERYRLTVRDMVGDIHRALNGFMKGQALVCVFLAIWYIVGLSLIGLQFGWMIGLFAGLLGFIPFVGVGLGLVLAVLAAIFQFGYDWVWIGAVVAVFVSAQFIEGNILSPKLVGTSVGLHPVWILFAVYFMGSVAGFVGLLVAVPLAAVIAVFVRYGLQTYKTSRFFNGI